MKAGAYMMTPQAMLMEDVALGVSQVSHYDCQLCHSFPLGVSQVSHYDCQLSHSLPLGVSQVSHYDYYRYF